MKSVTDIYTLSNGQGIPVVGYGTWQTPPGDIASKSVEEALRLGYRHIDTAAVYKNEADVALGIKNSGVKREEVFVTSKLWNTERGYDKAMAAFENTLKTMEMDYLDLYLVHWPASPKDYTDWEEINKDTWRAMIDIYKSGRAKSIGVSNFLPHHLRALMDAEVIPMINQIEYHPGLLWPMTSDFCKEHNILLEAWSPLGKGRMLKHELLTSIADKYNKTVAQVCVRFILQQGVLPLPKSITPSRIKENMEVFDFELSGEDMEIIRGMDSFGWSGQHPESIPF